MNRTKTGILNLKDKTRKRQKNRNNKKTNQKRLHPKVSINQTSPISSKMKNQLTSQMVHIKIRSRCQIKVEDMMMIEVTF